MKAFHLEFATEWIWVVLAVALALVATVVYYAQHRSFLTSAQRTVLSVLRWLGLTLLVLAFLMPVARVFISQVLTPRIAVVVDNSQSMRLRDGRYNRDSLTRAVVSYLARELPGNAVVPFRFGQSVEVLPELEIDSLRLDEPSTNLEQPFIVLSQRHSENIQAIVLVTDGAYNTGASPLYAAASLGKPVFAIGVGDSARPRDVVLTSIIVNERVYKNVPTPVLVSFTSNGLESSATLILLDGNVEVARQTLQLRPQQRFYQTSFEYTPQETGVRKLTARIEPLAGEFSSQNNARSEFVRVVPNERTIVLIAGALSPDVAAIRSALESDPSIQLRVFIQKLGAEFYGSAPTAADLEKAESIVMIGFPLSSSPQALLERIAEQAQRGKPLLFIASAGIDVRKLALIEPYLPFRVERWNTAEMVVTAELTEQGIHHALFQLEGSTQTASKQWNSLPPVFRPEAFVAPKIGAEILATIRVGTVPLSEPLIIARSSGSLRSVAVLGYGLYRWQLLGEGVERAHGSKAPRYLHTLMSNTLRWLSADESTRKVRIRTNKRHYTSGEPVEFIADIIDDALRPVDDATVSVTVRNKQQQLQLVLQPTGGGRYTTVVPGLGSGDYVFTGSVNRGGTPLGSDNGRFTVGEISLEYQEVRMNAELLQALAERTDGAFFRADSLANARLRERIEKATPFQPHVVTTTQTLALWNSWVLLAVAIALFAIEWFLRKRFGAS